MKDSQHTIIGRHLLVGLTHLDEDGEVSERVELHGEITEVGEGSLSFERADEQGRFSLPYEEGVLARADPKAVFTLRSTGEEVTGVDYVATFTVSAPGEGDEE